jgi:hypothetical protein
MKAHQRLLRLQQKIHGALESEVERLLGELPEAIAKYERSYQESFSRLAQGARRSSRELLKRRMTESQVVLVADYHTLGQAQRTALRLLQDAVTGSKKKALAQRAASRSTQWALGLEFVPSNRQAELDAYASGLTDTATFLTQIRYFEEWGFAWQQYAPLVDWARQNGVRLVALNRPRELPILKWRRRGAPEDQDLVERDRWAAGLITDLFAQHSSHHRTQMKMFVLYGELHVGERHLPAAIKDLSAQSLGEPLKCVTVHQNNDALYWKLAKRGPGFLSDVLELRSGHFHVISSTPWNKLQSVVGWAESLGAQAELLPQSGILASRTAAAQASLRSGIIDFGRASGRASGIDDEWLCDLESEALSKMQYFGEGMADFLKLPVPAIEAITLQSVYSADFVDELDGDHALGGAARRMLRQLVQKNARFYIPWSRTLYLGIPSANGVAEMAAIVLARGPVRSSAFFGDSTDTFFQAVLDQAFGFFGSLLVNPRRKCDLPQDHLAEYLRIKRSEPRSIEARARLFTLAALDEQASFLERIGRRSRSPGWPNGQIARVANDAFASGSVEQWLALWFCARHLGQILGKLLHQAVLHGQVELEQVRELAWQASDRRWRPAEVRYWEWVATVAEQPVLESKRQVI